MKHGVIVRTFIHGMIFDGAAKDPMSKAVQDALIGFMVATAEAQAEATKAAQRSGIAHAKASADNPYRGCKPSYTREQFEAVRNMLALSTPVTKIAKETRLSRQTIYRINEDPAASEAVLYAWWL
jgi:putative DNA-invertase from lambdoid prophage Rac